MNSDVILKNKKSIEHMIREIDQDEYDCLFNSLKDKKCLYVTGIGKNFHVANIIASTFNSLSIRSIPIDPVSSVHGDMGLIEDGSTVIVISKSGNTDELEFFCQKIKNRKCGSTIILLHSNKKAKLKKYSDLNVFVPFYDECDPWGKVPTCSLICYLILLHSVGMHIVDYRNIKLDDFYKNHPGGDIGANCSVKI